MRYRYWLSFGASITIAIVFLSSGIGKLMGQSAFLLEVSTSVINPALAELLSIYLPWIEITLGVCLLVGIIPQIAAGFSAVLVAAFILHNSWLISLGLGQKPCPCLGVLDVVFGGKLSTTGALYIDIGLIIIALAVYVCYPGKILNIHPWLISRGKIYNNLSEEDTAILSTPNYPTVED